MADERPDWLVAFHNELNRRIDVIHHTWQLPRSRASPTLSAEKVMRMKHMLFLWGKQQAEWSNEHDLVCILRALARDAGEIQKLRKKETAAGVATEDQNSSAAEYYQDQAGWLLVLFDQVEVLFDERRQDKTWGELMPWDKTMYRAMVQTVAAKLIKETEDAER